MNKWIIRIIVTVVFLGAFAGVGIAAYRIGYGQGMQATGSESPQLFHRFDRDHRPKNLLWSDNRSLSHGFEFNRSHGFERGMGFGNHSPFRFLFHIAIFGLVIWLGYKLFQGNGWTLSLTRQSNDNETESTTAANNPNEKVSKD